MKKEDIYKQLELYSNAILGFMVVQGLAFCYKFGSDANFNTLIRHNLLLSIGLSILLIIVLILALLANQFLGRKLAKASNEEGQLVTAVFIGKSIVIGLFGILPAGIIVYFAIISPAVQKLIR